MIFTSYFWYTSILTVIYHLKLCAEFSTYGIHIDEIKILGLETLWTWDLGLGIFVLTV